MTTKFLLLRSLCGFSQQEAADFLKVSLSSIKKWDKGIRNPNPNVLRELAVLYEQIEEAAENIFARLEEFADMDVTKEIAFAVNDQQAKEMGFPTASSHNQYVAMVLAWASHKVIEIELVGME